MIVIARSILTRLLLMIEIVIASQRSFAVSSTAMHGARAHSASAAAISVHTSDGHYGTVRVTELASRGSSFAVAAIGGARSCRGTHAGSRCDDAGAAKALEAEQGSLLSKARDSVSIPTHNRELLNFATTATT
jgi:hypothetical protein